MKTIILISFLLFYVSSLTAQNVAKKIGTTSSNLDSTNKSINVASNSINGTSVAIVNTTNAIKTLGGALGLHSHKGDKAKDGGAAKDATQYTPITITISGINYSKLELTQDSIGAIQGVKSADMTFNASGSTINVLYTGKPSQLWHSLSPSVKDMFEVQAEDASTITVLYKK